MESPCECGIEPPGSISHGVSYISLFRENNNVVVFPIPFQIFMPLANWWLIRLQGQFPVLNTRSCPDLYPLIRPPGRPLALGRGRILIPGFIRFPPMLFICYVAHSLPLGSVGRDFTFTEDETEGISHTSLVLLESICRENIMTVPNPISTKQVDLSKHDILNIQKHSHNH